MEGGFESRQKKEDPRQMGDNESVKMESRYQGENFDSASCEEAQDWKTKLAQKSPRGEDSQAKELKASSSPRRGKHSAALGHSSFQCGPLILF